MNENLVYDASLFVPAAPPRMVYLPSKALLRKLMRQCASCTDYKDLYYLL